MLLRNGSLTDKTLLIIDEPESNLHPQWIIEYARIIVMLNKELGVKFFIATHNPDMVSAIRYISEKEGVLENVNFYLAEKSSEKFKFNYKFLNKEIDPIFESFNIAIERINKYGI
jgi:predicted ATPase